MHIMFLSLIIQILLVIHILKNRRDTVWVWIVIIFPLVGSVAYIVVELIPGYMRTHQGRQTQKNIQKILNPQKSFNDALSSYEMADTVRNTENLAFECMNKGMYEEARNLYLKALDGVHSNDPQLLHGLAQAEFSLGNYESVKTTLNRLMEHNPDYQDNNAHLLYARALEGLGEKQSALDVYEALESYAPGPEALYRYAMLLRETGNSDKSKHLLEQILRIANISGKHYQSLNKEWINNAKRELHR